MLQAMRTGRSWVWVASGLLTAAAVLTSYGLTGRFVPPEAGWLADAVSPPPRASERDTWRGIPSVAVDGWLPESRWNPTPAFDVRNRTVEVGDILDMPPGVEDIPSLDKPRFVPGESVTWLAGSDEVIGIATGETARCYPLPILRWHSVVNDLIDGRSVAIVYDPLSGASLGVRRVVEGRALTLGVSGKAYNGCALLYDRESRSLWYPLRGECIAGKWAGRAGLKHVAVERTTWDTWRQRHAGTQVLSRNTGFGRAYHVDPYAHAPVAPDGSPVDYWAEPSLVLAPPRTPLPTRGLAPKTLVLGVRVGEVAVAYVPPKESAGIPVLFVGKLAGHAIKVRYDAGPAPRDFSATLAGERPWQVLCFWYAWQAAYPSAALVRLNG